MYVIRTQYFQFIFFLIEGGGGGGVVVWALLSNVYILQPYKQRYTCTMYMYMYMYTHTLYMYIL